MNACFDAFFARAFGSEHHPCQRTPAPATDFRDLTCASPGCGRTAAIVIGWIPWRLHYEPFRPRRRTPRRLVSRFPIQALVKQSRADALNRLAYLHRLARTIARNCHKPSWRVPTIHGVIALRSLAKSGSVYAIARNPELRLIKFRDLCGDAPQRGCEGSCRGG